MNDYSKASQKTGFCDCQ